MSDNTKLITSIEKEFKGIVKKLQRQLLLIGLTGVASYAFDRVSRSRLTVRNIQQTNRIALRIVRRGNRQRTSLIDYLVGSLLKIFDKNKDFYKEEGATQSVEDAARKRILLLYGYNVDKKEVVKGGYIDQVLNFGGIASQVAQTLNRSLASRQTLRQIRLQLGQVMGRGQTQGVVAAHFTRFTRDLHAEFDRAVKLEYKERLGLKHAVYAGTEIDTTRDFCEERLNNVYTEEEILTWNEQNWRGKKPGDVRIVLGGYNCRHSLNWISEKTAMKIAEKRGGLNNYN